MWLWIFYIGSAVLSYLLYRNARPKAPAPGEIQPPEVPAGQIIPVAFGQVKLSPVIVKFDYGTFRNDYWPAQAPSEYWAKWLGILCWGFVDYIDILYDGKRYLSEQGTQHAFMVTKNTDFFSLGNTPTVTDFSTSAIAHGGFPDGFNPGYRYAEIFLPRVFGGTPPDGEGGIESVVKNPACVGRTVYGAQYVFYSGGDQATRTYLDVPPEDDVKYYGGPPKDGSCVDTPTTTGAGRINYERFAHVLFGGSDGGAIGSSPVLKSQEFICIARTSDGGLTADDGGTDANPAAVLYSILTDPDWGLGISPALVGSFSDASTTLDTENFGVSGVMSEQKPAEDYINEVLRTIDAVMYRHPVTGLESLKLIRADYTLADLPAFTESNITSLEWTRKEIGETTNEVVIAFTDRKSLYNRNVVTLQDHANIHATGSIRSQTLEFPWISNEIIALKVGARELKAGTLPLGRGTMDVTRAGWGYLPGDPIKVSFAKYGLSNVPCRILSANYGKLDQGIISFEIVQDVYGLPDVPYTVVDADTTDPAATPADAIDITVTENNDGTQGEVVLTVTPNDTVTDVLFTIQSGDAAEVGPTSGTESPAFTYASPAVDIDPTLGARISWTVEYTVNGVATSQSGIALFRPGDAGGSSETVLTSPDSSLPNSRVITDTATITKDTSTAGQLKLNVVLDTDNTLAANSDTAIAAQKAVKGYVDNKVAGLSWKQSVRAATTSAHTLATDYENGDTIDGVTLATGDRILIKNQATASENGIYVVAASGAPSRATDADTAAEIRQATVYVEEGTTNADTQWTCSTNAPITLGSTGLTFAQLSAGGGASLSETTVTVTTASLATGAEETGTVALGKTGIVSAITVDRACRVRLYQTSADRTADASRVLGNDPSETTNLLAEWSFTTNGSLRRIPVTVRNGDSPRTSSIYYAITNLSGSSHTVQVDFLNTVLET